MLKLFASLALTLAASHPLVIGDSITVRSYCTTSPACIGLVHGMRIDGYVGRQFDQGIQVARGYHIPRSVVVELGTNGPISIGDVAAMMAVLHAARRVVFVTCYVAYGGWSLAWQWCGYGLGYGVNQVLASAARRWHKIRLARWDLVAAPYLVDSVHPNAVGSSLLRSLIRRALSIT